MLFKATTIAPAGRYKYGNYYSSNNVTNHVTRSTYAGNTSNGGNEGGGNTGDSDTNKNYLLFSLFQNNITIMYGRKKRTKGGFPVGDVIAAIATGKQISAIGIIRVSGDGCAEICNHVFHSHSPFPVSCVCRFSEPT